MNVGDVVIYTEGGKDYSALVMGERFIPGHDGQAGEPTLTLAFVRDQPNAFGAPKALFGTGQTNELLQIRLDVAHQTHSYTADQVEQLKKIQYDGGRWREVGPSAADLDAVAAESKAAEETKGDTDAA